MKSNKRIIFVLAIAIVLCIVSAAGIYMYLAPQRDTIYVFRGDYTAGTQVTREMLMPVEVDSTITEMGEATDINKRYVTESDYMEVLQNAGTLRYDVTEGTALMKSMLSSYGGSKVELAMKPSAIAITVPSDYLSAVTNELTTGAYVNVYASYDNAQTVLILQNIRVLTAPRVDGIISGVTLEVDHEQSMKLVHAMNYGKIIFGLVNGMGYQYTTEDQPTYDIGGFIIDAETSSEPVIIPEPEETPSTPEETPEQTTENAADPEAAAE